MSMKFKTVEFVERSELFKDCHLAWEAFEKSDPFCSWGSNDHSIINASYIFTILTDYDIDEDDENSEKLKNQIQIILDRIISVGFVPAMEREAGLVHGSKDFYVDLEN